MDARNCQTSTVAPAEPGGFPFVITAEATMRWTKYRSMRGRESQPVVVFNRLERPAFEMDLLPVVEKYHLGVTPYFSLAAGFLTGKYRNQQDAAKAARGAMVGKYLNPWGFGVVAALDEVANAHGSTPARVALAWLLAQPGITAPIASATNEKQLADLAEATKLKLDAESIKKLNAASARKGAA